MTLNKHGQLNTVFTPAMDLMEENCFAAVVSFNTMQGVSFCVQRDVNGTEHLLRIVVIIIKILWVVALRFVQLEGHYHMLWHSDGAARVCNCWATFAQHGIDLQICIQYVIGRVLLRRELLKCRYFAARNTNLTTM